MLAESGSESGCGRLKAHPQSEQRPVCWPLSLVLSSMVLSTIRVGGKRTSSFDPSENKHIVNVYSDTATQTKA